jgi:beta-phosphoglucomutase-like phosphatase (HAD superfamily)
VRCAVVEDSMPGVRAGIAAGMTVFALADAAMRLQLPEGVVAIDRLHDLAELIV